MIKEVKENLKNIVIIISEGEYLKSKKWNLEIKSKDNGNNKKII